MRRAVFALAMLSVAAAQAAPCVNGLAGVPAAKQTEWARQAARQMDAELRRTVPGARGVERVRVDAAFLQGGWTVLHVVPGRLEAAYLFYSGDPALVPYVTQWSGAASKDEREDVRAWVLANAAGIPGGLAACFAETVTPG